MERELNPYIIKDLSEKLVLLSGPRQCGKTTLSKQLFEPFSYYNYDAIKDRKIILKQEWDRDAHLVIFDELHKMRKWKSWLKGIYDTEGIPPSILVTGSARLDTYRRGGDSLAGRHFLYRLHPFSVRELKGKIDSFEALDRTMRLGGFPEPFLKNTESFSKRWRRRHLDEILREDLTDLHLARDVKSIELLIELLRSRVGSPVSYESLRKDLNTSFHTLKKWVQILENLYVIFRVTPYHKNVARSILKEPKYYFYDTGAVDGDQGARLENAVACNLLRELHFHEDTTGNRVALHYLRNKDKEEVDFLTVVEKQPRHMIEVKFSDENFDPNIFKFQKYFSKNLKCFQLVHGLKRKRSTLSGEITVSLVSADEFLSDYTPI